MAGEPTTAGSDIASAIPGVGDMSRAATIATNSITQLSADIGAISGIAQQGVQMQLNGQLQATLAQYGIPSGQPNETYTSLFERFNAIADRYAPAQVVDADFKITPGEPGVFYHFDSTTNEVTLRKREWGFNPFTATASDPVVVANAEREGITPEQFIVIARTVEQSSQETTQLAIDLAKIKFTANLLQRELGENRTSAVSNVAAPAAIGGAVGGGLLGAVAGGALLFASGLVTGGATWVIAAAGAAAVAGGAVAGAATIGPAVAKFATDTVVSVTDANTTLNDVMAVVNSGPPYEDPELQAEFESYMVSVYPDAIAHNSSRVMQNMAGSTQLMDGLNASGKTMFNQLNNHYYLERQIQVFTKAQAEGDLGKIEQTAKATIKTLIDRESTAAVNAYPNAKIDVQWMKHLSHMSDTQAAEAFAKKIGESTPLQEPHVSRLKALRAKGTIEDVGIDKLGINYAEDLQAYIDTYPDQDPSGLFGKIQETQNQGMRGLSNAIRAFFEGLIFGFTDQLNGAGNEASSSIADQAGSLETPEEYEAFSQNMEQIFSSVGLSVSDDRMVAELADHLVTYTGAGTDTNAISVVQNALQASGIDTSAVNWADPASVQTFLSGLTQAQLAALQANPDAVNVMTYNSVNYLTEISTREVDWRDQSQVAAVLRNLDLAQWQQLLDNPAFRALVGEEAAASIEAQLQPIAEKHDQLMDAMAAGQDITLDKTATPPTFTLEDGTVIPFEGLNAQQLDAMETILQEWNNASPEEKTRLMAEKQEEMEAIVSAMQELQTAVETASRTTQVAIASQSVASQPLPRSNSVQI